MNKKEVRTILSYKGRSIVVNKQKINDIRRRMCDDDGGGEDTSTYGYPWDIPDSPFGDYNKTRYELR